MNKNDFFNLLFSSVKITVDKYPHKIFYCYNKNIERQIKYNKLFNSNKPIIYKYHKDDVIFEQDTINKYLWLDYDIWWSINKNLSSYKNLSYSEIITTWLLNSKKIWDQYTPTKFKLFELNDTWIDDTWIDTKWHLYTPILQF